MSLAVGRYQPLTREGSWADVDDGGRLSGRLALAHQPRFDKTPHDGAGNLNRTSMSLVFAYYCSGHGYGHATRVSALAQHLLDLDASLKPAVYIVSSAPKHVFVDSIAKGAIYRNATIDPVIVQPLAYRVDRERSVSTLRTFLDARERILEAETRWLRDIGATCVLSDAAFIGCLAATDVGIPSILVTNFTFDSVYSYLATSIVDTPTEESHESQHHYHALVPDTPIPLEELAPLVEQIHAGYRCADMLLRLPGHIPIPSFFVQPALPSPDWVDPLTNRFRSNVFSALEESATDLPLLGSIPYAQAHCKTKPARSAIPIPLLVRPTSAEIYTPAGRAKLLASIGVPAALHDPRKTKILVVSFGGQVFRRPSRSGSATPSPSHSRRTSRELRREDLNPGVDVLASQLSSRLSVEVKRPHVHVGPRLQVPGHETESSGNPIATPSHLWIPGAPPAAKSLTSPTSPLRASASLSFQTIPGPSEATDADEQFFDTEDDDYGPSLLPDDSWIAIVCGVSKEQWNSTQTDAGADSELPDPFYIAPRDVYMPDLTAVGDVLLGKLGYGTVSECLDSATPFVYVSRPLFIEEHGLRRLLSSQGVGVELSRARYEAGDWAGAIDEAYIQGRAGKEQKRAMGVGSAVQRAEEGREMAEMIVGWAEKWQNT
ncbi:hypothetical protein MKEN_01105800 [Mycena kentingensis (nom. inval.)]|nr:hypothetical protein MKEN_01105800 [Mycena kentingensis (nom. inval.)]